MSQVDPAIATGVLTFGVGAVVAKVLLQQRLTAIRFSAQVIVNIAAAIVMGLLSQIVSQWEPNATLIFGAILAGYAAMKDSK